MPGQIERGDGHFKLAVEECRKMAPGVEVSAGFMKEQHEVVATAPRESARHWTPGEQALGGGNTG